MDTGLRMLHLGLGAFHRAHQASYFQDLRDRREFTWHLAAGNLRPDQALVENALRAQGNAYTLETISPAGEHRYRRMESIRELLPYEAGHGRLIELAARADTRILSFTVTEGGYGLDGAGKLDEQDPAVAADIRSHRRDGKHASLYGVLAAMLSRRRSEGNGPITLLSCDNLRHNGTRLRAALLRFLDLAGDPSLRDWTQANTRCPNSMVDRITPRPESGVRARVRAATGREDACAVMAEDFRQWVVEEDFCNGRPPWEQVGVQMVDSVLPYEEAKIRILNASHSLIAWAGVAFGTGFIHEGVQDGRVRQLVLAYVQDVIASLGPGPLDLAAYRDSVLSRFGNAALADSNQRVAADSAAKQREFVLPTLRERLQSGAPADGVAMLPALFLDFLRRWTRGELPFAHADQAMDEATARGICADADPVRALVAQRQVFGELAGDERLLALLRGADARARALLEGLPA